MNKGLIITSILVLLFSCEKEKKHYAVVYGHAGCSLYSDRSIHPPNTMESVEYALDVLDADGVEIDVQLTKDSVLVVYHDPFLDNQTNGTGCINDKNWDEIKDLDYTSREYRIPLLKDVVDFAMDRHKRLFLDIKFWNGCQEKSMSLTAFNYALNNALGDWDFEFRRNITVNARDIHTLVETEDTVVVKCFETDDVDLGILYFQNNNVSKLCMRASLMDQQQAQQLRDLGIPWCIWGVKTPKEIKDAYSLLPDEMISDNIAYAKKQSN